MDKIVFTDVSRFVEETKPFIKECFINDAYVTKYISDNFNTNYLFTFYNWAFRFSLYQFFGVLVADLDRNGLHNLSFKNVFLANESKFGNLYFTEMNHLDIQAVTQSPTVQVAFNGKYLFIMPCHAII